MNIECKKSCHICGQTFTQSVTKNNTNTIDLSSNKFFMFVPNLIYAKIFCHSDYSMSTFSSKLAYPMNYEATIFTYKIHRCVNII
jgi:hypothetical protein